jgi:hypothetical protein
MITTLEVVAPRKKEPPAKPSAPLSCQALDVICQLATPPLSQPRQLSLLSGKSVVPRTGAYLDTVVAS